MSLQTTISCLMKMAEISQNGKKTLWEKEKLLVTRNFSFSLSVFKRPSLQTRENQGLFGKGLTLYHISPFCNEPEKYSFENMVGNGENADNHYFLQFPQCLWYQRQVSSLES